MFTQKVFEIFVFNKNLLFVGQVGKEGYCFFEKISSWSFFKFDFFIERLARKLGCIMKIAKNIVKL